jgi:hypothetical protein
VNRAAAPLLVLASLAAVVPAHASDEEAKQSLTEAIISFGRGDLAAAKVYLDEAQAKAGDLRLLAQIHRQRGVILAAEGARGEVIIEFLRGLYYQADLQLHGREHRGDVTRLFDCARTLHQQGMGEAAVRARLGASFGRPDWTCPAAMVAEPVPERVPEPSPEPAHEPSPEAAPPPLSTTAAGLSPAPAEPRRSIVSSPIFWIVIGVLAAGGAAAGIAVAVSGGEAPYDGSTGVTLVLPGD